MNLKNQMIFEAYKACRGDFVALGDCVQNKLQEIVEHSGIEVLAIEHRVKTEKSFAGKLELKGDKYASLADVTDILGARIICFFSDDVDKVAQSIETAFAVDWENSVDKRKMLDPNAFGYLSLHYICYLEKGGDYPDAICNKKFEVQIRSSLQHTWSAINHDLGYKSDFGVPRAIVREFSRVAGLLEIADECFVTIRNRMTRYSEDVRTRLANDTANDIAIDLVSLREYVQHSKKMREFMTALAAISHAEISEVSPESYLVQLQWLGIKTIGDLLRMLENNRALALGLAKASLEESELDILSSNVGLRFLCRAQLLHGQYTVEQIAEFIALTAGNTPRAMRQAKHLLLQATTLKGVDTHNE